MCVVFFGDCSFYYLGDRLVMWWSIKKMNNPLPPSLWLASCLKFVEYCFVKKWISSSLDLMCIIGIWYLRKHILTIIKIYENSSLYRYIILTFGQMICGSPYLHQNNIYQMSIMYRHIILKCQSQYDHIIVKSRPCIAKIDKIATMWWSKS